MYAPKCIPILPTTLMRPCVIPRPTHLTCFASPRISNSSPPSPSTVKKSSTRSWRLPRNTGSAPTALAVSPCVWSGERDSASSGTFGCSLRVKVIMFRSFAGPHFGPVDAFHLHGIIVKGHRVDLLKRRPQKLLDLFVIGRLHDEFAALRRQANLSLFQYDLSAFDDVARVSEHTIRFGVVVVDG